MSNSHTSSLTQAFGDLVMPPGTPIPTFHASSSSSSPVPVAPATPSAASPFIHHDSFKVPSLPFSALPTHSPSPSPAFGSQGTSGKQPPKRKQPRQATPSEASVDKRLRGVNWDSELGIDGTKCMTEHLIDWMSYDGHYNKWRGDSDTLKKKEEWAAEAAIYLKERGASDLRDAAAVSRQITKLYKSFTDAKSIRTATGSGVDKDPYGTNDPLWAMVRKKCKWYKELLPVFEGRAFVNPGADFMTGDDPATDKARATMNRRITQRSRTTTGAHGKSSSSSESSDDELIDYTQATEGSATDPFDPSTVVDMTQSPSLFDDSGTNQHSTDSQIPSKPNIKPPKVPLKRNVTARDRISELYATRAELTTKLHREKMDLKARELELLERKALAEDREAAWRRWEAQVGAWDKHMNLLVGSGRFSFDEASAMAGPRPLPPEVSNESVPVRLDSS